MLKSLDGHTTTKKQYLQIGVFVQLKKYLKNNDYDFLKTICFSWGSKKSSKLKNKAYY